MGLGISNLHLGLHSRKMGATPNLLLNPEEFENASWTKVGIVTAGMANVATAPNGTATADRLIENTGTTDHYVSQTVFSLTGTYVLSVFAKPIGSGSKRYLTLGERSTTGTQHIFDVDSGLVVSGSGSSITPLGDGWYRCSLVGITLSGTNFGSRIGLDNDGSGASYSYTGDGVSGLYIWRAQLSPAF